MKPIWIVLIVIIVILIIAIIAFLIYWYGIKTNYFNLCYGSMKSDGLCCDSIYTETDYNAVKALTTSDKLTTINSDYKSFMVGLQQYSLDKSPVTFFTKSETIFYNLEQIGYMYYDETNKNVFITFNNINNYNDYKDKVQTTEEYNSITTFKSIINVYKTIKDIIRIFVPDQFNSIFISSYEDSGPLMYFIFSELSSRITSQKAYGIVFGQIPCISTSLPSISNLTTEYLDYRSDEDLYSKVSITTTLTEFIGTKISGTDETMNCKMDYHKLPYIYNVLLKNNI